MRLLMVLFLTVFAQALVYGQADQLFPIGSALSSVTNSDDSYQNVSITSVFPSGIRFGNTTYTSMYVGSNGYVTFGHGNSGFSPTGIQAYTRGPIIAAQYDDLDPRKGGGYLLQSKYFWELCCCYFC